MIKYNYRRVDVYALKVEKTRHENSKFLEYMYMCVAEAMLVQVYVRKIGWDYQARIATDSDAAFQLG